MLLNKTELYDMDFVNKEKEVYWGFYGSRILVCRNSLPNKSYQHLQELIEKAAPTDYFIITQNDHGFLQKQGFPEEKLWEMYGNIHNFQCVHGKVFNNKDYNFKINEYQEVKEMDIPKCNCEKRGAVRPNILLHNDSEWNTSRSDRQELNFNKFIQTVQASDEYCLIFEIGINPERGTLDLLKKKMPVNEKALLIRVPYYCPKNFIQSDKFQPDDRELEDRDPIFGVSRDQIVKVRVGAPVILEDLLYPDKDEIYKNGIKDKIQGITGEEDEIKKEKEKEKTKIEPEFTQTDKDIKILEKSFDQDAKIQDPNDQQIAIDNLVASVNEKYRKELEDLESQYHKGEFQQVLTKSQFTKITKNQVKKAFFVFERIIKLKLMHQSFDIREIRLDNIKQWISIQTQQFPNDPIIKKVATMHIKHAELIKRLHKFQRMNLLKYKLKQAIKYQRRKQQENKMKISYQLAYFESQKERIQMENELFVKYIRTTDPEFKQFLTKKIDDYTKVTRGMGFVSDNKKDEQGISESFIGDDYETQSEEMFSCSEKEESDSDNQEENSQNQEINDLLDVSDESD